MKRVWKKLLAFILAILAVLTYIDLPTSNLDVQAAETLSDPRIASDGVATWDCIYFGRYPQSDVITNTNEPIKWRVLKVENNKALLFSDKALDFVKYNETRSAVTWETCTLRQWLNQDFFNRAFTSEEQLYIQTTHLLNEDNQTYGTEGGVDTDDKVFVLSSVEFGKQEYGFINQYSPDEGRKKSVTMLVKEKRRQKNYKIMEWDEYWTRSIGSESVKAVQMQLGGDITKDEQGVYVDDLHSVCPALWIDISDTTLWRYAGTVSSNGKISEINSEGQQCWDGTTIKEVIPENGVYYIDNAEKLAWLSQTVRNGEKSFAGESIVITGNIYLGNNPIEPIGNVDIAFQGNITIKDCTFSGLKVIYNKWHGNGGHARVGLFGNVICDELIMDNVVFDMTDIYHDSSNDVRQGLFGNVEAKNINVSNVKISAIQFIGGGWAAYEGGLFGNVTVSDSFSIDNVDIFALSTSSNRWSAGGSDGAIAGALHLSQNAIGIVRNCDVKLHTYRIGMSGGMLGYADGGEGSRLTISKSIVETSVTGGSTGINGGMIGNTLIPELYINECHVWGDISPTTNSATNLAGLIAMATYDILQCENVYVEVEVPALSGGFLSYSECGNYEESYIKNCYYSGTFEQQLDSFTRLGTVFVSANSDKEVSIPVINCRYDSGTDWIVSTASQKDRVEVSCENVRKLTAEEMKDPSNFEGWDTKNIWYFSGEDYPVLRFEGNFPEGVQPVDVSGFDEYIYRANYLTDENSVGSAGILSMRIAATPCNRLNDAAEATGLNKSVATWEGINAVYNTIEDPTSLGKLVVKPKDMYSAIIMNLLEASYSYSLVNEQLEDGVEKSDKILSTIRDVMEKTYQVDVFDKNDFKNLTLDQREKLSDIVSATFKDQNAVLYNTSEVFKGITLAFDTVDSIEDYYNRIVSCVIIRNISEDMKTVLRQAYIDSKTTGNVYLQWALQDCIEVIDTTAEEMTGQMLMEGITTVGVKTSKWLFKEMFWDSVMSSISLSHPVAAVLMKAYKGLKLGVNEILSTDKISEQYLYMLAVEDIEELFDMTSDNLRDKFINDPTSDMARAYLSSLDMVMQTRSEDCDHAYKFVDIVDSATVNRLAQDWGLVDSENETVKSQIRGVQKNNESNYLSCTRLWIADLEEDYPGTGLYEYYDKLYNQQSVPTISKELKVACPVDVYVYDSQHQVVAFCAGDVVSSSEDNIAVVRIGDEKTFLFFEDQDYTVEYIGNDTGLMDVTVTEFDEDEETSRTVNFYDVSLTEDKTYEMPIVSTSSEDLSYDLTDVETQGVIAKGYDSASVGEKYQAVVKNGIMTYREGMLREMEVSAGERIEVQAYVPEGYHFVKWEADNGADIFKDALAQETTFVMPAADCMITAVLEENDSETQLTGNTLSLTGNIAMNFYMQLSDKVKQDKDAYMQFTYSDGSVTSERVSDARQKEVNGVVNHVFTCELASTQMTGTVYAQMVYSDGSRGAEYAFSVKEYADAIFEGEDSNEEYAKAAPLIRAMLNYGSYAQQYFLYDTLPLANQGLTEEEKSLDGVTPDMLSKYTLKITGEESGLQYYGSSLILRSETSLRHYFTLSDGMEPEDFTFTLDGEPLELHVNGPYYYVEIPDITSGDLDREYSVTAGNLQITYSALTYVNAVLQKDTTTPEMQNLMKALYLYNQEANTYFESREGGN